MKQISKFLVSEYWLELSALAFGALVLLGVWVTAADLWRVIIPITGSIVSVAAFGSLIVLALALYFLPTLIARKRKHRNVLAIFVLNLFFTPIAIGWIAALVWACLNQTPTTTVIQNAPQNIIPL